MIASAPSGPGLSDDQLRILVGYVARVCLEVERGLRPPEHLYRLSAPRADHLRRIQPGRFRGGAVVARDIGPPEISRLSDGHVLATIVTRTEGSRWGALTLRLRAEHGRWYVADLQRLLAAAHYRTAPQRDVPEVPLDTRIRQVAEERRVVAAALTASNRRVDELGTGGPGTAETRRQAQRWSTLATELDRELRTLKDRHATRSVSPSAHR